MTNTNYNNDSHFLHTRRAVIWTNILNEPLLTLYYSFVSVILYRDLQASSFQLAAHTMLKPLVALLSLYWSTAFLRKPQKRISNIILTGTLARIPFFFIPFIDTPWLMIVATSSYMMLSRGGMPAWMEVIKQNLPEDKRSHIFSMSSALGYIEGVLLGIGLGIILDSHSHAWKWLFPTTALIGMVGLIFQSRIKQKPEEEVEAANEPNASLPLKEYLLTPWKESLTLLKNRKDFRLFQVAFMFAGAGMMVIPPIAPIFFVDYLHLSYVELGVATAVCKGLGFAFASPFWSRYLNRTDIYQTSTLMFFTVCFYPLLMILALIHPLALYLAYFCYGVAQAGSHLSWNLSGTIFSKNENSQPFSNVNVLTVGIRGMIIPPIGTLLLFLFGPIGVFLSGISLCLLAGYTMARKQTPIFVAQSP